MKTADYSTYFPTGAFVDDWGIGASAAGHARVPAHSPYPPLPHPHDHTLTWRRGRTLHEYQIIYIRHGQGRFESQATGPRLITEGTLFLLFPHVWHRYRPDRDTGWTEDWIELRGPAIEQLHHRDVINPRRPLFSIATHSPVPELFNQCHALARAPVAGHQALLGLLGLQILAHILFPAGNAPKPQRTIDRRIQQARSLLSDAPHNLCMHHLAQQVGMSYSYFRRTFKSHTGLSPKQYQLQLRLRQAQQLLAFTTLPIRTIAEKLGYDSPFHLSADFKARTGQSPTQWRGRSADHETTHSSANMGD
jgi:AraC-like DNA-binding protein